MTTVTTASSPFLQPLKVVRNLSLKRMRGSSSLHEKVKLDRVLGLTVASNAAFCSDSQSGCVAYPAGCVVVLLDVRRNKQSHVVNSARKSITSLSFSSDGRHIITGECGQQPCVRIWDTKSGAQLAEFDGHKYGVTCVAFSPTSSFAVSVGSQHDMIVNVWDWKNNEKVASNKVSAKVKAVSFSEDGNYFVTVGMRHVKFWYLDNSRPRTSHEPVPLMGRSAILGDQRNNMFCDVGCGKGAMRESTYVITESGLLCEFNSRRLLDKWVELRTSRANCLIVGENIICIGCADGIVRVFNPNNLHFICTLPRPHALGTDVARAPARTDAAAQPAGIRNKYADTVAITLIEEAKKVICVYSDHSMYVWDVRDFKKVGKSQSYLYHSACIWGIEPYKCARGSQPLLPPGTFLTCSSDDTIRVWNLEHNQNFDGYVYKRNIFSHDLLKILYTDPEMKYLCEQESASSSNDGGENGYDGKNGVRCLKISPDGIHLASGDRSGNINVKDLSTQVDVCKIEAHDSEVLCLEYSDPQTCGGNYFLCSASRDRLIHLFDVDQQYSFVQTLDDHSSAITAIKFVPDAKAQLLQLLSCGADKSIIFRRMSTSMRGSSFTREHHVVGKTTLYDMELDQEQTSVLTACQDRQIRVYSVESAKLVSTMKGTLSEDGTLIKIAMDPSGQYFATSSTDKLLSIFDYQTGECVATASGHSELITGLKFSVNGRTLTSVSGDGCIFVWKLPAEVANAISSKLGLPPVPPEKPAFFSALRSQPDLASDPSDQHTHRPSTLPLVPKIKLDTDEYIRKLSDNNSLKRTELFITNNRFPKDRHADRETDLLSPARDVKNDDDSASSKNLSVRSDEETPSGSDILYFYPQDDDSLQRNSFEIRTDGLSYQQAAGTPTSGHNVKSSSGFSNFNDSPSDEEEKEDSEMTTSTFRMDLTHRRRNPLYASSENVSAMRRALHSNFTESCSEQDEGERDANRTSLSSRFALSRGTGRAATPSRDTMNLSRSTSVSSLSGSKRREELSKAMGEARRRLESVGWNTSLSSSKSVADLSNPSARVPRLSASSSFHSPAARSCSMSDLTFGPPKRIFQHNNPTPAPIWDQNRSERDLSQAGSLKKSTSISSLIKSGSRSRMVLTRPTGVWSQPQAAVSVTTPRRSGRASAPPVRVRLNGGSLHGTQSSEDESSSTDEDESSSSFIRTLRPGTPPKPSILRQVRRSSTSHVVPNTIPKQQTETLTRSGRTRKLWDNFELRSSKSEYNLSFVGRDLATTSRSSSKVNLVAPSAWQQNRIDFSSANPATIDLTRDTCEQALDELSFMAIFVRKLFTRSQSAGNSHLTNLLTDGVMRTYQTLSAITDHPQSPSKSLQSTSASGAGRTESSVVTMNLLQQYSDRLMSIMEQRMGKDHKSSTDL